jgi:hypothetical protein
MFGIIPALKMHVRLCVNQSPREIDRSASEVQTALFAHLLQRFQPFWKQHYRRLIHGSDWSGREDITIVVDHGDDFLALLVLVA